MLVSKQFSLIITPFPPTDLSMEGEQGFHLYGFRHVLFKLINKNGEIIDKVELWVEKGDNLPVSTTIPGRLAKRVKSVTIGL